MQDMAQPAIAREANYVLTLEEIGNLAQEGGKPAETLMNVVALIARRFQTDVCSAYLLEPDRANLVLAATLGLRPECIGTLRMAIQEGLAGLVAEQVRPIAVEQVERHPRFRVFSRSRRRRVPVLFRRPFGRSRSSPGRSGSPDDRIARVPGGRDSDDRHSSRADSMRLAANLEGHLTATIHGTEEDLREYADLLAILKTKVRQTRNSMAFPPGLKSRTPWCTEALILQPRTDVLRRWAARRFFVSAGRFVIRGSARGAAR